MHQGGINAIGMYAEFRVNEVTSYAETDDDSNGREIFKKSQKKESSIDFGNIFTTACDELKAKSGITHQNRGFTSNPDGRRLLASVR